MKLCVAIGLFYVGLGVGQTINNVPWGWTAFVVACIWFGLAAHKNWRKNR